MKILDTKIPEVKIIEPDVFGDHRGWFMETWSQPKYESLHFAPMQDNESFTAKKGTLRGIHFQQDPMAQAKIVRVVRGAVMDVAMSISSALTEVHTVAPDRDGRALFRSGRGPPPICSGYPWSSAPRINASSTFPGASATGS